MQWNISSLKPDTFRTIREFQPHFLFLQETRQIVRNSTAYNYVNLTREEIKAPHPNGGGIAIGIASGIVFRNLTPKLPEALRTYEILFVQAIYDTLIILNDEHLPE